MLDRKRGIWTEPIETSVSEESQPGKVKAEKPETASIKSGNESNLPLKSPPPTSIGPFARPRRSAYISALASAPRYPDLHIPVPLTRNSAAASRTNPLLLQVAIPRSAIVNLTRYQAHPDSSPVKAEEVTATSTSISKPAAMHAESLPFVTGRSHAATRAICSRRSRRVGPVAKRTSRSSRASQASAAFRAYNSARPVVHKASGRPS